LKDDINTTYLIYIEDYNGLSYEANIIKEWNNKTKYDIFNDMITNYNSIFIFNDNHYNIMNELDNYDDVNNIVSVLRNRIIGYDNIDISFDFDKYINSNTTTKKDIIDDLINNVNEFYINIGIEQFQLYFNNHKMTYNERYLLINDFKELYNMGYKYSKMDYN
jgi:hypothetical protein